MFFEMLLPVDYEIISNKHIIERDRVVEEKTLELKYSDVNFNKSIVNNKTLKENSFSKAESMSKFQQLNFKYANPFFVNLTKEQKANLSKIIDQKDLKHLVLQTYSNDNEIAIKRLTLLAGTKRAALLDKGMIQEADITLEDLRNANKVSLFNAMIEFGEREIAMENVHF
jgi:hypothetical protein